MVGDNALHQAALEESLPTSMRLVFEALARANVWGHAAFQPGEMGRALGRAGRPCSANTRKKAFETLKSGAIIAPESTSLCVVLNGGMVQRGDRARRPCKELHHADRDQRAWIAGAGWEPSPGYWRYLLDQGPGATVTLRRTITETETVTKSRTVTEELVMPAACGAWYTPQAPPASQGQGAWDADGAAAVIRPAAPQAAVAARPYRRCDEPDCGKQDAGMGLCWEHRCARDEAEGEDRERESLKRAERRYVRREAAAG